MKSILVFLLIFAAISTFARNGIEEIKKDSVSGSATGDDKTTPDQVKQRAINDAKINALVQAGIEENLSSYSNLYKSEDAKNYGELFTSDIFSNIRGDVKDVKILRATPSITAQGYTKYDVVISCTVIKYTSSADLTLDAKIDGLKPVYSNLDPLKFTVEPNIDCYLRVFLVSADVQESFMVYPNTSHQNRMLTKSKVFAVPDGTYDLELETKLEKETENVIFVLLKEDIPFNDADVTYEKIYRWISNIPLDKRKVITQGFFLVKKK